jgi:hypothetical protein
MLAVPHVLMRPPDMVAPADQVHPHLTGLSTLGGLSPGARQRSQTFSHGGVDAFTQRGIERLASCRQAHQVVRFLTRSPTERARDVHHPCLPGPRETGGHAQSGPDCSPASSSASRPFHGVSKGPHHALWRRIPAIGTDQQTVHTVAPSADVLEDAICQVMVSTYTHHSCQPDVTGGSNRQAHPAHQRSPLCAHVIGVDVRRDPLCVFTDGLMDPLAVRACPLVPLGSRAFIHARGVNHGLNRTSRGQHADHENTQVGWCAHSFHHGASSGANGPGPRAATSAWWLRRMNPHGARSPWASCGTRLVRAPVVRRIHRLCWVRVPTHIMPMDSAFFTRCPPFTGSWGCTICFSKVQEKAFQSFFCWLRLPSPFAK